jgi:phage host-nuclease inhibitor protein Gam
MARASKKVVAAVTREEFDENLQAYATADAKEQALTAKMDEAITKIRSKYADDLAELKDQKDSAFEVVQAYCTEHEEIFGNAKSVDTVHGRIGFRTGNPSLKPLRGFTWTSINELIKAKLPGYMRRYEEADKESLLADRNKPEIMTLLPSVGIQVKQDERFYIDLKKEEPAEV